MNARLLQDALAADLRALFSERRYKTPQDGTAAPSVFLQNLPKRDSEDDADPFPYIIVRIDGGKIETQTDPHNVSVILLVGIYDDDKANQGHRAVMEILEVIQQHYEETPLLDRKYTFSGQFAWTLQDEESYPYYFGAAELAFDLRAPRRKASDFT